MLFNPFLRALRRTGKILDTEVPTGRTDDPTTILLTGPMSLPKRDLGMLMAHILRQAANDRATRVSFAFRDDRLQMIYTIAGTDYEMVPPPVPVGVDLAKEMLRAAGATCQHAGTMTVWILGRLRKLIVATDSVNSVTITGIN